MSYTKMCLIYNSYVIKHFIFLHKFNWNTQKIHSTHLRFHKYLKSEFGVHFQIHILCELFDWVEPYYRM